MNSKEELENLIKNDVLIEIEDYIDELFEIIASKTNSTKLQEQIQEELKNVQEMKKEFSSLLIELENNELSNQECEELIKEIKTMKNDSLSQE